MARVKSQSHRGSPRWPWAISVLVTTLALVVASAPLAHLAHFAEARHVVCEHGELIHVEEDEGSGAEPQSAPEPGVSARPGGTTRHGHTHCALAARGRSAHTVPTLAVGTGIVGPIAKTVVVVVTLAERRDVLRFAPKTSPPALA